MSATTSTNIMPSIVFNCYLALLMQIRAVIAICFDLTGRQRFKITFYYVLPMLLLVSLRKKRTAKRLSVTNVTGLLLACFVRNSPNIDVFCSSAKDLFKGMWSLAEGFLKQDYCRAYHTRFTAVFPLWPFCTSSLLLLLNTRQSTKIAYSSVIRK